MLANQHHSLTLETSGQFNAPDADLLFRSSNNILFRIHSRNLEVTSGGFPPAHFAHSNEHIDLTEDSSTLELMFHFVYPRSQPNLEKITFEALAQLAEAVEKYQVYPAMQLCKIHMEKALPDHALDVLKYSLRHGYPELIDQAAPHVTLADISAEWNSIPLDLLYAWLRYYDSWNAGIRKASLTAPPGHKCSNWPEYQRRIFSALGELTGIKNDESISAVITVPHFAAICCKGDADQWRKAFIEKIRSVPPLTNFI
ncbi:hypothetical protein E4T56_gene8762 [Termitomyces sp. T112]|nr:hypothetical protein E4T56_gene8762 [Termitomyces sp. T112]KAH0585706.1 hypothetical protein H2248_008918 [Termitomyces sp. 'cryptogamus']